ncbi:MAG: translation initiation factor IF-6 [Candidatus Poseidoniia archaeon]|nr:translation initiation factor IF-6 [Candidatus Poseidoniia archaeon]|tara:strand:+ start:381 stop:1058 length:678 start_codon:yes stop_codon:yes gene_type:complete
MALLQKDLFNSPYSGVFCATNDLVTLVPPGIPDDDMEAISEALGTKVEVITIGGSSVLGTLIAMNNKGILVSNLITTLELEKLEEITAALDLNLGVLSERSNAIGNNFLLNDSGGFCNERLSKQSKVESEKIFEVDITSQSLNGMDTLGMIGCANTKGGLCHPEISDNEKEVMEKVLKVPVMEGTVNFGMPLVGAGIISSSKGAICGRQSTGVELGRVEEALKLF